MAIGYTAGGTRYSWSDTSLQRKVVQDSILLIDPTDTPYLAAFPPGGANDKFDLRLNGTTVYVNEDALRQLSGTASATHSSAGTTLTVTASSVFKVGDIILLDSEYMWISALASSTTLTVTRNVAGTQATHATGTITVVGQSRLEGATADQGPTTTVNQPYNYVQHFEESVKVTNTAAIQAQYGVDNELSRQRDKKIQELNRFLEYALTYHVSMQSAGSTTTTPPIMGSLATYITTAGNYSTTTGAVTKALWDAAMLSAWEDGGTPDILLLNPSSVQNILNILASTTTLNITQGETVIGQEVSGIKTQWGDLKLLPCRRVNKQYMWFLDSRFIGTYTYDDWYEQDLAITGSFKSREILASFSQIVAFGDTAHALLYTTATTGL